MVNSGFAYNQALGKCIVLAQVVVVDIILQALDLLGDILASPRELVDKFDLDNYSEKDINKPDSLKLAIKHLVVMNYSNPLF